MSTGQTGNVLGLNYYQIRRDMLNFWHKKFRIYDQAGNMILYTEMKAMKLKEDIRIFADEGKTKELLTIKARKILDLAATYDVSDSTQGGAKVGALKRQGLKSIIKDEWKILNPQDQEIGKIEEDSTTMALIRRFLPLGALIPQGYAVSLGAQELAEFKQNFNPFVYKLNLDFGKDPKGQFDRRLGLAGAVLLAAIEGKQSGY